MSSPKPPQPSGGAADAGPQETGRGFSRALAVLVAGAFFMENLDATIIAPAAPAIAADLGVDPVQINVAMTAYLLTVAVLIPGTGWLTDRFGPRPTFTTAVALFTVASIACAFAPTLPLLTAARVVQGIGGAMMVPVGRLAVLRTTRKSSLIAAIAYLTWPALVAPVLAPVLGGYITTYLSWHWIFLLNVPLGIVGVVLSLRLIPDMRSPEPPRLDWKGFLLTAIGVAALVIGLEQIGTGRVEWPFVIAALGVAVLTLGWAVGYLLRSRAPLIDLRTLRISSLRASVAGGTVYRLVITAIPFLLPLYYQLAFGWTAAQAGTILIALFAGNLGIKPLTTPLMRWWGIRTVLLVSVSLGAACIVAMAFFTPGTSVALMVVVLALSGIFRSIGFSAYNALAFADVPSESMTQANTVNATIQGLAAGLGIAVGALLVRVGEPLSAALGLPAGVGPAYQIAFVLLAVLMIAPVIEAAMLPRTAGGAVTGR